MKPKRTLYGKGSAFEEELGCPNDQNIRPTRVDAQHGCNWFRGVFGTLAWILTLIVAAGLGTYFSSASNFLVTAIDPLGHAPDHQAPSPKRFLLFSTQRSGSTWLCSLLNAQDGAMCGIPKLRYELMMEYSGLRAAHKVFSQTQWEKDADKYFQRLRDAQNQSGSRLSNKQSAIGFKLQYDQVAPDHERFVDYLQRNNIAIIHLVREASILILASRKQFESTRPHMTNATEAKLMQRMTPAVTLPTNSIRADVQKIEKQSYYWVSLHIIRADALAICCGSSAVDHGLFDRVFGQSQLLITPAEIARLILP